MPFVKHENIKESICKNACKDPEHNPPSMIVLKPGIHHYECPSCKNIQIIIQKDGSL